MLNTTVQIHAPTNTLSDTVPADVYQIQLTDVSEKEGTDFNTGEPKMQFKFTGVIVEGEEKGKVISFFCSNSWFNGGKTNKPSKLFNIVKNLYTFYKKGIKVSDMPVIEAVHINELMQKQVRVATEVTKKGWPKVTSFMPIKKEVKWEGEGVKEDVNPDEIPL